MSMPIERPVLTAPEGVALEDPDGTLYLHARPASRGLGSGDARGLALRDGLALERVSLCWYRVNEECARISREGYRDRVAWRGECADVGQWVCDVLTPDFDPDGVSRTVAEGRGSTELAAVLDALARWGATDELTYAITKLIDGPQQTLL